MPPPAAVVPDPRASVFYRVTKRHRATVWRASPADPSVAEQLPIVVDFDPTGDSAAPALSGDGQWLAFLDQGHLTISTLDGSTRERITRHGPAQVGVSIAGFSADGSGLLYGQHAAHGEGALSMPADVEPGLYVLALATRKSSYLAGVPELSPLDAQRPKKSPDGAHVAHRDIDHRVVVAAIGAASRTLVTCTTACEHAWESASTVLVLDGGELARFDLDGGKTVLGTEVVGFTVAGANR